MGKGESRRSGGDVVTLHEATIVTANRRTKALLVLLLRAAAGAGTGARETRREIVHIT